MKNKLLKTNLYSCLIIATLAFVAVSSAIYSGHPSGNDLPQHYQFAVTIHDSLSNGEIYPNFATKAADGLGDYGIRFYPPLAYYAISAIFMVVGSWYYAGLILFYFIFLVSGIGTYLWAKENFTQKESLLAAAIFIFAPYHLNQIYNNFLFAEFAASALIPFCFLFITRVFKDGRIKDVLGLSIFVSILILTHLPSTIICAFAFSIYSAVLLWRNSSFVKTASKLALACSISVLATSFYWMKLVFELDWINHNSSEYFDKIYSFQRNFLLAPQNYINFKDDILSLWLAEVMLLAMLFIAIPSLIYFVKNRKELNIITVAITVLFVSTLFLMTPLSKFIWSNLPLLPKIQFPWRLLGIFSLTASLISSVGIVKYSDLLKESKNILLPVGLGFIFVFFVISASFITKQASYISKNDFTNERINKSLQGKSFECWWTAWEKPINLSEAKTAINKDGNANIKVWNPKKKEFILENSEKNFEVLLYYYPHWKAFGDATPLETKPTKKGLVSVENPDGYQHIELVFQEPKTIIRATYLSFITWIMMLLSYGFCVFATNFEDKE